MSRLFVLVAIVLTAAAAAGAASATPAANAKKLSAAEQKWVTPMLEVWNSENTGLQGLNAELANQNSYVSGSAAYKKLLATLTTFAACPKAVSKGGKPPTTRLAAFYTSLSSACTALNTGATSLAKGIGEILSGKKASGTAKAKSGIAQFSLATKRLATARKQVLNLKVPGLAL